MKLPNPFKPWFVYRPRQLFRRVVRAIRPPANPVQVVGLPWGCSIEVDVRETIGRSIWTAGVHDLAVGEGLYRLADPALLAIDAGANIGAMTGVLAARAGEVWAFEPHPVVYVRLVANAGRFAGLHGFAPCRVFQVALSDTDGEVRLETPEGFAQNQGTARVSTGSGTPIPAARLDTRLAGRAVGVMKMDVEGHELNVLRGAEESLAAGQIRHLVFEDHAGPDSPVCRLLAGHRYALFEVGWRLGGPVLAPPASRTHRPYEAPSFLATRDPDRALARCRPGGWECFHGAAEGKYQ
jgi:FkbM family methyltransferase